MINDPLMKAIIAQAQQELITPSKFYLLCQEYQHQVNKNLYFLAPSQFNSSIPPYLWLTFFDYLAKAIINIDNHDETKVGYVDKVTICFPGKRIKKIRVKSQTGLTNKAAKFMVKIAGYGMVGKVAYVKINQEPALALKVFFDPNYVWLHGPWGEIPAGIYLQAHQVTKDLPEFKFASINWAVWEWIEADTKPEDRQGISYQEFAQKQDLTRLNELNKSNYNPHQIRVDIGGIQKEYKGRLLFDFFKGIVFYIRKISRDGLLSLTRYLTWKNVVYLLQRIVNIKFW